MENNLNFQDFFKSNNDYIAIYTESHQISEKDDESTKKLILSFIENKWFMIVKNNKLFLIEPTDQLFFGNKKVNLMRIQIIFRMLYEKWKKEFPLIPFPLIIISKKEENNRIIFDTNSKEAIIYLTPDVFFDYLNFKMTLSHELGHLIESGTSESYKEINYKFNHKNLILFLLIILFFGVLKLNYTFYLYEIYKTKKILIHLLNLGINVVFLTLLFYYIESVRTFNQRMKFYNRELFCDFFSLKFGEINFYKRKKLYYLGDDFLGFTHPRGIDRYQHIRKNKNKNEFVPLTQKQSYFFQFSQIDGIFESFNKRVYLNLKKIFPLIFKN